MLHRNLCGFDGPRPAAGRAVASECAQSSRGKVSFPDQLGLKMPSASSDAEEKGGGGGAGGLGLAAQLENEEE